MQHTLPKMNILGRSHSRVVRGGGMGSVLLNKGGPGVGSSYESPESYERITDQKISGRGLGGKLERLSVKPLGSSKRTKNISF